MLIRFSLGAGLVLALTMLTQVGGLAYLLALAAARALTGSQSARGWATGVLFFVFYASISVSAVLIAPSFGRTPLPCLVSDDVELAMQSPLYCALNRHYVTPQLKDVAVGLSSHIASVFPGTVTLALDGNFPFLDGFPLLPHLSHNDGRKLDFAFYYRAADGGYIRGGTRSPIGYWAFEEPAEPAEAQCGDRNRLLTLRWNMRWFKPFLADHRLDREKTRAALQWLITDGRDAGVSKTFIEPHLVASLGVESDIIRFQGCRVARHDDHIHIQIRP